MINTISQLNKFVASQGAVKPENIIAKLADSGTIVSYKIARLLAKQLASKAA